MTGPDPYSTFCEQRRAAHQFRRLRATEILPDGRALREDATLINFSSNDYLGLSRHPALIARVQDDAARYGAGSTASRLIAGNNPLYDRIEQLIADGKGYDAALVFNSGYQANVTALAALADAEVVGRPVTVLADRLCHHSLLQGAALADARLMRFQHNDYTHLETLLRQQNGKSHVIIVSESVFGMDGDCADIAALLALKERFGAMLYIDEAHATGLYGLDGFGLCASYNGAVDVAMGTFGKALGSFGAYIACNETLRDYLIQRCGGLTYSTALPPAVLGAICAALELLPHLNAERAFVAEQAARLRAALREQGWDCGLSTTHIIPVILGGEEAATALAEILAENGVLAPAIRPPTVPRGTSRLRISLSAAHRARDIDHLIEVMAVQAERFASPARQARAS